MQLFSLSNPYLLLKGDSIDKLPFNLETVIHVCRQTGYFEHASYLAKKYEWHKEYLRIQIEDARNYADRLWVMCRSLVLVL